MVEVMTDSPSPPRAEQSRWRAVLMQRRMGAVVLLVVMPVLGIIGLATGHTESGITAIAIGGIGVLLTIAARAKRGSPR